LVLSRYAVLQRIAAAGFGIIHANLLRPVFADLTAESIILTNGLSC